MRSTWSVAAARKQYMDVSIYFYSSDPQRIAFRKALETAEIWYHKTTTNTSDYSR